MVTMRPVMERLIFILSWTGEWIHTVSVCGNVIFVTSVQRLSPLLVWQCLVSMSLCCLTAGLTVCVTLFSSECVCESSLSEPPEFLSVCYVVAKYEQTESRTEHNF